MSQQPQILQDMVAYLKTNTLVAEQAGDGRIASTVDETNVVKFLQASPRWNSHVEVPKSRAAGDLIIKDGDKNHLINIKSTTGNTDNAKSKLGFIHAFTDVDISTLSDKITDQEFAHYMETRKTDIPWRDYWYLVFLKTDMQSVMLRGSKQIVNWKHNPSNGLQINWKKEFNTPEKGYTFEESYENVYGGYIACVVKQFSNYSDLWKQRCIASVTKGNQND